MLTAVHSQHKSTNSSVPVFKQKTISLDSACLPPLISLDTVDNPLLKQLFELDIAEENIIKQMKSECNRLYSFQDKWPLRCITPESLSEAGFFYLQDEDKVQCPFCRIIISKWTQGDKPLREHMKKSPKCPFLIGQDVGNVPLSSKKQTHNFVDNLSDKKYSSNSVSVSYKPKHPRMADVKRRLLTYPGWPLKQPEPQQLAECGLYYSGVADVVTCFFCGGNLGNWVPHDNPWNEHTKYFPECSFLALNKHKQKHMLKNTESSKKPVEKQMGLLGGSFSSVSEIVEQALDIFPENLVLDAVKKKSGSPFTLQEICDDILTLKRQPTTETTSIVSQEISTKSSPASNMDILLCKVCMDKERGVVFQPCGHFISCWSCSNLIANCPVCRTPIAHKIRTYIS